jgi:DNA-binding NarL/FixJ family response regulator
MSVTSMFFDVGDVEREVQLRQELTRPLSPREGQIVSLLHQGHTPKEVAFELGIAAATVRVLISRAAKKGGVARAR